ncbi:MAG: flagellar basal body P-ring formation protein FlgA [Candidatus Marinimicrobia bacterium]|nr:flagellar basal body P-ring formation protein FlgA [Candidatus Neomarinimicrobiota bacterium]
MKILNKQILLIILFITQLYPAELDRSAVISVVSNYYQTLFNIEKNNLNLRIAHFPDIRRLAQDDYVLEIEDDKIIPKLGYQTLHLLFIKEGIIIKKYPVSVDVSIYQDICVTKMKVSRNTAVSTDNIIVKRVLLKRSADGIIYDPDKLKDLIFARPLSAGRVLHYSDFKKVSDVKYGDRIQVRIISGPLTLFADAKVLGDAIVGGEVKVYINQSAVKRTGRLIAKNLAEIHI